MKDGHEIGFCLCVVYVDDILLLSTTKEAERTCGCNFVVCSACEDNWRDRRRGRIPDLLLVVSSKEKEIPLRSLWVSIHIILTLRFWIMVLLVGLRMFLTFRDIWRKHSRIATFRNLCQMKHTHAFRKALGKLLWLSQVRHDLKTWMSVLGTQQAKPMHGTEQALKASLEILVC